MTLNLSSQPLPHLPGIGKTSSLCPQQLPPWLNHGDAHVISRDTHSTSLFYLKKEDLEVRHPANVHVEKDAPLHTFSAIVYQSDLNGAAAKAL